MTMENLSISEPTMRRSAGMHAGSVLVVLDVNKSVNAAALYWTLNNVARKDDTVKILGIVTHLPNASKFFFFPDHCFLNAFGKAMCELCGGIWPLFYDEVFFMAVGFMTRVDQSIRNNPNIMELQFEIASKKEAIWRTNHINEWCQRNGVCRRLIFDLLHC